MLLSGTLSGALLRRPLVAMPPANNFSATDPATDLVVIVVPEQRLSRSDDSLWSHLHVYFMDKTIGILCSIKNENEQYLIEWIDYHKALGVDNFYIFRNCS